MDHRYAVGMELNDVIIPIIHICDSEAWAWLCYKPHAFPVKDVHARKYFGYNWFNMKFAAKKLRCLYPAAESL